MSRLILVALLLTGCGPRVDDVVWDVRCPGGDEVRVKFIDGRYRDEQGRKRLFPQTCTWTEVKQ